MRPKKLERRKYYRQLQSSFTQGQYEAWNQALAAHLLEVGRKIPSGSLVAVYSARPKEADLSALFSLPLRFCFPRILDREGIMEFREIEKPDAHEFHLGHFGILEPKDQHPLVTKEEVHSAFIPLLAFDDEGRRLGQGKGFYDRFLDGFTGQRIGVGFEWQHSPAALPIEGHDEHMHLLVTDQGVRRFPGAKL